MSILGNSLLGLWVDIAPAHEAEFNRWYLEEHLAERVHVPGFLRGRRFEVLEGAPKYFTAYEQISPEVLRSDRYVSMLNHPTPETSRMLPHVRNGVRTAYEIVTASGHGDGVAVATIRFDGPPDAHERVRERFRKEIVAAAVRQGGVQSAALCEAERVATGIMTVERRIGGASTPAARFLFLCELDAPERLAYSHVRELLDWACEGALNTARATYRLTQSYTRPGHLD